MPIALALSPHLDDAAFSCGGLLASLAREGWHVVMATLPVNSVADPTGFALACQLDKGLSAAIDYMALRRAEDIQAAAALGIAPPRHLPFREAAQGTDGLDVVDMAADGLRGEDEIGPLRGDQSRQGRRQV
ncbi:MAG: PIG-L family deacetylase, partial [Methylobacterium sp.]